MNKEGGNEESMARTVVNPATRTVLVLSISALGACTATSKSTQDQFPAKGAYDQAVGESGLGIHFVPVKGGSGVDSFYMSDHEVDWDVFDAFVFDLEELPVKGSPEAETRPTRPYMLVDRGFGHAGYPAISMSRRGAEAFCLWLSQESGRSYRLPTTAEWSHACKLGKVPTASMTDYAWYDLNADWTTHPVGTRAADALGLHDMHGNVAEWAVDDNGNGVVMGGSFLSSIEELGCSSSKPETSDWNESDPQIPRSVWWLADGPFIGFRVVSNANS